MFNLIGAIISGFVVGLIARGIYWGDNAMGFWMTVLLGVGGSVLAGLVASRGSYGEGFHRAGCFASVIGAIVLIFVGRMLGWHF